MKRLLVLVLSLGAAVAGSVVAGSVVAGSAADLLVEGNYAAAYEAAQASKDPLNASRAALAQVFYKTNKDSVWIDRALAAGQAAVKAEPNNPEAYLNLGGALGLKAELSGFSFSALSFAKDSRAALEKGLALAPNLPEAQMALASWHAGGFAKVGFLSGGKPSTAKKLATQAITTAPNSIRILAEAGQVYLNLRDHKEARAMFEKVALLTPHNAVEREMQAQAKATLSQMK